MMFYYPLLLVARKEYLECLQRGQFFMKNCLYYQEIDDSDSERSDKYDGAVKSSCDDYNIPDDAKKNTSNQRLTFIDRFIKCFYQYKIDDRELVSPNIVKYSISKDSQIPLFDFNEEYALLIFNVKELIERFEQACQLQNLIYCYDSVSYVSDDFYPQYEKDIYTSIKFSATNKNLINPVFVKREKYKNQQEFRFCVKVPQPIYEGVQVNNDYILDIDDIYNISVIVRLKDICDYPIIFNGNNNTIYFRHSNMEGRNNEKNER